MVEKAVLWKAVSELSPPAILAFGDPLLDIIVILNNDEILKRYNIKLDDETEISEQKMQDIILNLPTKLKQRTNAGGPAQNTVRILQWLFNEITMASIGIICGSRGNDGRGVQLEELICEAWVTPRYKIDPSLPTGTRISFILESSRSLVTNTGAAGVYTLDDLKNSSIILDTVKIIYIEGFFITHSLDVIREVIKEVQNKDIIIAFNLCAVYIFKEHHAAICEMVGAAKIVFGNTREMIALAQALSIKYDDVTEIPFLLNSLKRVSMNISCSSSNDWLRSNGTFVMSQDGSASAMLVWGRGQSVQVKPIVPKAPIVDTTGAEDALIAGFLTGVLARWDPETCLEWGCKVASMMMTRLGVTLPTNVPPDLMQ